MRFKQSKPKPNSQVGRIDVQLSWEECRTLFGNDFKPTKSTHRILVRFNEGLLTVTPTTSLAEGTHSLWLTTAIAFPYATTVSPSCLVGVDFSNMRDYVDLETRSRGGSDPKLTAQMPMLEQTHMVHQEPNIQELPAVVAPECAVSSNIGSQLMVQNAHSVEQMLEHVYRVKPEDKSSLRQAMQVINQYVQDSNGAVQVQVNSHGELEVMIAQFEVRMQRV